MQFLVLICLSQLSEDQSGDCQFILSEKDFVLVLKSVPYNELPHSGGLTKIFYEVFWEDLKTPLISGFKSAFDKGELSNSQKKIVIRLIKKKKKKILIQTWRPIPLVNVDLSKALPNCIKRYLPFLISLNQIAYAEGRFIGRRWFQISYK